MENKNINTIIKHIEKSELWERLNNKCREMYQSYNRTPSDEEYQALRNILICKVMLEDPEIKEMMCQYTWEELQTV